MSSRANYFKIGLFVLSAAIIAVAGLIVFGSRSFWQEKIYAESYFEQSVQGLDVGSPVKFRGVQIGRVESIGLVSAAYATRQRYVLVRFSLYRDAFGAPDQARLADFIEEEVARGLRIRLAFPGVTGTAYLETDYVDEPRPTAPLIDWQPMYPFLPSMPSTIARYSEAIDGILKNIDQIDLQRLGSGLDQVLSAVSELLESGQAEEIGHQTLGLITDLRSTARRLDRLLADTEDPLGEALQRLPETIRKYDQLATRLNTLAGDLPEATVPLGATLQQFNALLAREQPKIGAILSNLQQVAENLREMTDDGRLHPARMFFGAPPPPVEP